MSRIAELAAERHSLVRQISQTVITAIQALWGDVPPNRILSALQGEAGRQILAAVTAGQMTVAQGAEVFVSASLLAQGAPAAPLARLNPGALVGMASDARPLISLLYLPAITAARSLALGESEATAALRGMNQMGMLVGTQIADTARAATSVAMAAHPRCISYVRVVSLPACARCVILSGRQYSYSTGFKRHPRCDCGMSPMTDAEWKQTKTPEKLFQEMSPEEQRKRLGVAGVKALEAGADLGQIINSRRGMATAATGRGPMRVTTEGTTKRGIGGKALDAGFQKIPGARYERAREARLMPETIFKLAGDNREHQIAMLRKHGYIT
ncbi:VG15 protein [Streptomyces niveus]|uniref:VG15 protein n=1 Tax=Streptomyces niveus TaxID=193462 RepID=UPI003667639E